MQTMATKTKRITSQTIRESRKRDNSPKWEGVADLTAFEYRSKFYSAMDWYRLDGDSKLFKPAVLEWMKTAGFSKDDVATVKAAKDWRITSTMGAIALCLKKGMPDAREDFNGGKKASVWLANEVRRVIAEIHVASDSSNDTNADEKQTKVENKKPNIQERLREVALSMTDEIEQLIDTCMSNPTTVDIKQLKIANQLRGKQAKAAHARIIRETYESEYTNLVAVQQNKDESIVECYSDYSKSHLKKLIDLYKEIVMVCTMLEQESKASRTPKVKKSKPKEKIVEKLKYLTSDNKLKLASVSPTDIIGAKELWVYNTKTRKLGKYVAAEYQDLGVKGSSIIGYDETKSVQKTLRKPDEQLQQFKKAGKVELRKFLEQIKSVDIKLNGRCNEFTLLLKVY